jgi:ABC-type Mn2+/Zn2+ transport system ATPase subunit
MLKITEFNIRGLYDYRDITIPIRDNRIVLVGVNGLGKTTIINLLYFFLSRQWKRIYEYKFLEMSLKIGDKQISITPQDVESENLPQAEYLKALLEGQILYLPTYRRIEKELEKIFPELDEYIGISNYHNTEFIELIEFGMRDVDQKIDEALLKIKENARTELNNLAGSYLRDVIRRKANSFDQKFIKELNDETITKILNRVDEKTLSTEDQNTLRTIINKMKNDSEETISEQDKYLAHFFAQLVNIHQILQQQESAITQFIKVCNHYLIDKQFFYNEKDYQLEIKLENETPLKLHKLSSGEKQIVSLFSHLYLSGEKQYLILLDEPELSLSVEWQKHFLPDILASKRCLFLATATHSPFIFDNELDDYAADIRDYIKDIK